MVKLKRPDSPHVEESLHNVEEKFEGSQGRLWKSGQKGTATMFSTWVSNVLRANTVKNSAIKTRREYVTKDGDFETLNISYGRKDALPLDIRVRVPETGNSVINLKYRDDPKVAHWVEKNYSINNPMSLSVDPETKKLISVVFTGPQFSFAGQSRKLEAIPGYIDALSEIEKPIIESAKILDAYDDSMYKSRNLADFEALPEVYELKDLYKDWNLDIDASKLDSQNKVTYIFNHPENPDFSFKVSFKDEGGSDYRILVEFQGREMSLANLAKLLEKEIKRLAHQDDKYSEYESKDLKKVTELKVSGASEFPFLNNKEKLDAFVKKLGDALEDFSLARWANIDITQNEDGSEDWELILKTQHGEKSIFWHTSSEGKVDSFRTNFGYDSKLSGVNQKSEEFFKEITKAAEKFLSEYGAYNRPLATVTDIDDQIMGGKDWIQSYDKPAYDLANWSDVTLGKIEPELEKIIDKYNLDLTRKTGDSEDSKDAYLDFLAKYGVLGDNPQAKSDRYRSGNIIFTGSFIDKNFVDHLLELRVNFDRGDRFVVWIRPDLKGSENTKSKGQSDLSFLEEWAETNVSKRGDKKNSINFLKAISQELLNLGAVEGDINGTFDISTSKVKSLTIDLKVTNNKVLANAYRDGKLVGKVEMDIEPFAEQPVKVAKSILSKLAKMTKESFLSMDRRYLEQDKYWKALLENIKVHNLKDNHNHILSVEHKKCKVSFSPLGTVSLSTMTGKFITEEQFCVDPRYFKEDSDKMILFLKENYRNM